MNSYQIFQTVSIILAILFCIYMINKCIGIYSKFSNFTIDEKKHSLKIDGENIKFKDIINITIDDDIDDYTLMERWAARDTGRLRADRINFELKDGNYKHIITRNRKQVYNICKTLMKYKRFDIDLDYYKEPFITLYELAMMTIAIVIFGKFVPPIITILIILAVFFLYSMHSIIGFLITISLMMIIAFFMGENMHSDLIKLHNVNYSFKKIPDNVIQYLQNNSEYKELYNTNKKIVIYFTGANCPYVQGFDDKINYLQQKTKYNEKYSFVGLNASDTKYYKTKEDAKKDIELSNMCKEFCIINPNSQEIFSINGVGTNETSQLESIFYQLKDW